MRSALAKEESIAWGRSEKAWTYAGERWERRMRTAKASVDESERVWALRIIRPARQEGGSLEVRRSTMRMREVTKKMEPLEYRTCRWWGRRSAEISDG